MDDAERHPRPTGWLVGLAAIATLAMLGFVALGVWQLQRLAWKESLIARVENNARGRAVQAPLPEAWGTLEREHDEYRRVALRGRYVHELETLVRASTELGTGYWVLTPLRTDDGFWVLVNRGFVPPGMRDPASRTGDEPAGMQQVTGLLRFSETGGGFLQDNDAANDRWYSRDVQAIAASRKLSQAGMVAPFFVDVAAAADTSSPTAWPRPGLTVLRFSNNHQVYALTWFALAAMMAGAIGYLLVDERRLRRLAGDRDLAPVRA